MTMTKRIRIGLVAAVAAALMLNGVAVLYAAATAPTITACVKASGAQKGLMRYAPAGKCASGESRLAWNVTGPTGPTGPAGSIGDGATAPLLYGGKWTTTTLPMSFNVPWELAALSLPAGTFDVRLSGWLSVVGGGKDGKGFLLEADYPCSFASVEWTTTAYGARITDHEIAVEDVVTLTSPGTVRLMCSVRGAMSGLGKAGTAQALIVASPVTLANP